MTEYTAGDRVAFQYVDLVNPGELPLYLPMEGVIKALPTFDSPYYEIEIEVEGRAKPYMALQGEIVGTVPQTWEREDVEAWLAR